MSSAVPLHHRECGDPFGAPVVLLHGSTSSSATWARFAPRLAAAGHRVITADLRGHAASPRTPDYPLTAVRDDVLRLLLDLDLRGVTLVGHSVGGYAALAAALEAPDRIDRLVLEDVAAPPREALPMSTPDRLKAVAGAAALLVQRRDYELRAVASFVRQLTRADAAWWDRLGLVTQPTLVLSGGPTSYIPPQRLAELAEALPSAWLTEIPVGHRVHSLAPDLFAAEVLAFLAREEHSLGADVLSRPA